MNISFIGYGNIAKAMASGLTNNPTFQLKASAPSLQIGIDANGVHTHFDNIQVACGAEVIILAVKPAIMRTVLDQITPIISQDCILISAAAGLKLAWFNLKKPIIRAMPNIAASINQSATPLIANQWVTASQKQIVEQLFTTIGITTWIADEQLMDGFTALSGSGPAYVFLFMEAMINASIQLGLSSDVANHFALQTFKGAIGLVQNNPINPSELRHAVTSPNGTTAAALNVFNEHGFMKLVEEAMQAAVKRSIEISQLLDCG